MRVAITGTPGTGKTTATELVETDLDVIHLNDLVREQDLTAGYDEERDSVVVDLDAVEERLAGREGVLVESHLAHRFPMDRVVVLRCRPEVVEERLREGGDSAEKASENAETAGQSRALARKARENAESEALDVILAEAVERHGEGNVYEVTTDDRTPEEVAREIEAVIAGERDPAAGTVDYVDYL